MKYAVFVPADQTIAYVSCVWLVTITEITTEHPHAILWDDRATAQAVVDMAGRDDHGPLAFLEEVPDEQEFRAREDTW